MFIVLTENYWFLPDRTDKISGIEIIVVKIPIIKFGGKMGLKFTKIFIQDTWRE